MRRQNVFNDTMCELLASAQNGMPIDFYAGCGPRMALATSHPGTPHPFVRVRPTRAPSPKHSPPPAPRVYVTGPEHKPVVGHYMPPMLGPGLAIVGIEAVRARAKHNQNVIDQMSVLDQDIADPPNPDYVAVIKQMDNDKHELLKAGDTGSFPVPAPEGGRRRSPPSAAPSGRGPSPAPSSTHSEKRPKKRKGGSSPPPPKGGPIVRANDYRNRIHTRVADRRSFVHAFGERRGVPVSGVSRVIGKNDDAFTKDLIRTISGTRGGMREVQCLQPINTIFDPSKGTDVNMMTAATWQDKLQRMTRPRDFVKYTAIHTRPNLIDRGLDGMRWEDQGPHGQFFGMALFPTILTDDTSGSMIVRPYAVCYSSQRPYDGAILHKADWKVPSDAIATKPYLDMSQVGDADTYKSLISAINLCRPRDGSYIWVMVADEWSSEMGYDAVAAYAMRQAGALEDVYNANNFYKLGGASLGLATIACLLHFACIAYTGFVRRFRPDMIFATEGGIKDLKQQWNIYPRRIRGAPPPAPITKINKQAARRSAARHKKYGAPRTTVQEMREASPADAIWDSQIASMGIDYDQLQERPAMMQEYLPEFGESRLQNTIVKVARGSDIVEEVDETSFKCGWAMAFNFPLVIPYSDPMGKPLSQVLDPGNPVWTEGQRLALRLSPNAYSMVQAEESIPYKNSPTPILIACTADEAGTLAYIAFKGHLEHHWTSANRPAITAELRSVIDKDWNAVLESGRKKGKWGGGRVQRRGPFPSNLMPPQYDVQVNKQRLSEPNPKHRRRPRAPSGEEGEEEEDEEGPDGGPGPGPGPDGGPGPHSPPPHPPPRPPGEEEGWPEGSRSPNRSPKSKRRAIRITKGLEKHYAHEKETKKAKRVFKKQVGESPPPEGSKERRKHKEESAIERARRAVWRARQKDKKIRAAEEAEERISAVADLPSEYSRSREGSVVRSELSSIDPSLRGSRSREREETREERVERLIKLAKKEREEEEEERNPKSPRSRSSHVGFQPSTEKYENMLSKKEDGYFLRLKDIDIVKWDPAKTKVILKEVKARKAALSKEADKYRHDKALQKKNEEMGELIKLLQYQIKWKEKGNEWTSPGQHKYHEAPSDINIRGITRSDPNLRYNAFGILEGKTAKARRQTGDSIFNIPGLSPSEFKLAKLIKEGRASGAYRKRRVTKRRASTVK